MSNTTSTSIDPVAVVGDLYAAFGRGDLPGLLALVADDVDWSRQVDAPGGDLVPMLRNGRGHDAVLHYFSGVADMDIHDFQVGSLHHTDDVVLAEISIDFTHRTTGKRARLDEIHRWVVGPDGKVTHYRPYVDTAALIDAFRP